MKITTTLFNLTPEGYYTGNSGVYKYNKENLEKAFNNYMNEENKFGCLGNNETIKLSNISHKITDIHINECNNSIEGDIEILDTPSGEILKNFIDGGKFAPKLTVNFKNDENNVIDEIISVDSIDFTMK